MSTVPWSLTRTNTELGGPDPLWPLLEVGAGRSWLRVECEPHWPPCRHLVSICPALLSPTSKDALPGHFLCSDRLPRGKAPGQFASSPPFQSSRELLACTPMRPSPAQPAAWASGERTPRRQGGQGLQAHITRPHPQPPLLSQSSHMAFAWAIPPLGSPFLALSLCPSTDTRSPWTSPSWLTSPTSIHLTASPPHPQDANAQLSTSTHGRQTPATRAS